VLILVAKYSYLDFVYLEHRGIWDLVMRPLSAKLSDCRVSFLIFLIYNGMQTLYILRSLIMCFLLSKL